MSYTDEQLAYINYDKKEHTKLLACAGSGKTRCIIARMAYLIKHKIYEADEILMLTFSRFTRDDFMNKIRIHSGKDRKIISPNSIKTIDSFAKRIIDPENTVDVSLLSYRLMKCLEEETRENLLKIPTFRKIKTVFIDEAQDLNEIQYRIFIGMRDKLDITINMVGDPNQNIYQFRDSSDKYLTQFDAKVFMLTRNFRSHESVVDFSKYLRPFNEYDVVCTKGDNGSTPHMMFCESETMLETYIITILDEAKKQKVDLSEFAILAPTRGRMRGGGKSHGLCFISNVLYKAGIKFKQFYEETVDESTGEGIKYEPKKGHVNVLTFMGSKGLEWNYVLLIDVDACLINKRYFDKQKHLNDRYLLYVACSRAIHNMYIFSGCYFRGSEPHFKTNPWLNQIPDDKYVMDQRFEKDFFWPELRYVDMMERDTMLGKVIDKLDCYDLDKISSLLNYQNIKPVTQKKIFDNEYIEQDKVSGVFLSRYITNLFHGLMRLSRNRMRSIPESNDSSDSPSIMADDDIVSKLDMVRFPEIESIIDADTMITGAPDSVTLWYYRNKRGMTWEKFDKIDKIDSNVRKFINAKFSRDKAFDSHAIAVNGYYESFILEQKNWIRSMYKKYLKCRNTTQLRGILFYLTVVMHAISTHHYFHIKSKGSSYKQILEDFDELYDDLEEYVENTDRSFPESAIPVSRWGLVGTVDVIDSNDQIWFTKCVSDISLKNVIYAIATNLMFDVEKVSETFEVNEISRFKKQTDLDVDNVDSKNSTPPSALLDDDNNDDVIDDSTSDKTTGNNTNGTGSLTYREASVTIRTSFINFLKGEELEYDFVLSSSDVKELMTILINNMGAHRDKDIDANSSSSSDDAKGNSDSVDVRSVQTETGVNDSCNDESETVKAVKTAKPTAKAAPKARAKAAPKTRVRAKAKVAPKAKAVPKARAKARAVPKTKSAAPKVTIKKHK